MGLTQRNLAGTDFSTAYISQVETGRCRPSTDALRKIAERLNRPIDFFLAGEQDDNQEVVQALCRAAARAIQLGRLPTALRYAESALDHGLKTGHDGSVLKPLEQLGLVFMEMREFDKAIEIWDRFIGACQAVGDREWLAEGFYRLGTCFHQIDDRVNAARYYKQSLRLSAGSKRLAPIRARTMNNLANCHLRLGDFDHSLRQYEEAIAHCLENSLPEEAAVSRIGLASTLRRLGQFHRGLEQVELALHYFGEMGGNRTWQAKHMKAVLTRDLGDLEQAVVLLRECAEGYARAGEVQGQAGALEEIARYQFESGQFGAAEETCRQALDLLDKADAAITRGRIYRLLAQISREHGDTRRAEELLRIAINIFKRVRASEELLEAESLQNRPVRALHLGDDQ